MDAELSALVVLQEADERVDLCAAKQARALQVRMRQEQERAAAMLLVAALRGCGVDARQHTPAAGRVVIDFEDELAK